MSDSSNADHDAALDIAEVPAVEV
ncbi:MAG: hypothetical protein RL294_1297, partial [Actinomycetota bacterium]